MIADKRHLTTCYDSKTLCSPPSIVEQVSAHMVEAEGLRIILLLYTLPFIGSGMMLDSAFVPHIVGNRSPTTVSDPNNFVGLGFSQRGKF
mgnify:CR=1 FL=1